MENYIRRLQKLEELTGSYPGVEKAYAIQAGREVRIMVKPEEVTEDNMILLARTLPRRSSLSWNTPARSRSTSSGKPRPSSTQNKLCRSREKHDLPVEHLCAPWGGNLLLREEGKEKSEK